MVITISARPIGRAGPRPRKQGSETRLSVAKTRVRLAEITPQRALIQLIIGTSINWCQSDNWNQEIPAGAKLFSGLSGHYKPELKWADWAWQFQAPTWNGLTPVSKNTRVSSFVRPVCQQLEEENSLSSVTESQAQVVCSQTIRADARWLLHWPTARFPLLQKKKERRQTRATFHTKSSYYSIFNLDQNGKFLPQNDKVRLLFLWKRHPACHPKWQAPAKFPASSFPRL